MQNSLFRVNWLAVHAYASQRMRARYAGSILGEFWPVTTTASFLIAVALVWSTLWRIPLEQYFAYFSAGFIFYTLIAGTLNESAGVIVADGRLFLNSQLSPMFSVFAHLYRNSITFVHNSIILVPVLILYAEVTLKGSAILCIGLLSGFIFLIPASYLLGMISVRYRDLLHVIHSLFQIMFLVTPVMWQIDRLPPDQRRWIFLNPVAGFMNLTRDALLGLPLYREAAWSVLVWTAAVWGLYFSSVRRLERGFAVWL